MRTSSRALRRLRRTTYSLSDVHAYSVVIMGLLQQAGQVARPLQRRREHRRRPRTARGAPRSNPGLEHARPHQQHGPRIRAPARQPVPEPRAGIVQEGLPQARGRGRRIGRFQVPSLVPCGLRAAAVGLRGLHHVRLHAAGRRPAHHGSRGSDYGPGRRQVERRELRTECCAVLGRGRPDTPRLDGRTGGSRARGAVRAQLSTTSRTAPCSRTASTSSNATARSSIICPCRAWAATSRRWTSRS